MSSGTGHTVAVPWIQAVHTFVAHLLDVALQISLDLLQQRRTNALANGQLLLDGQPVLLWYHNVRQVPCVDVQLLGLFVLQRVLVVLQIVLDAVVDVGYLGDIERTVLGGKVLFDFAPAPSHQVPRLAVIENGVARLGVVALHVDNGQKRLDELLHVLAALHGILDKVDGLVDADAVARVDGGPVVGGKVAVDLHEIVQTVFGPASDGGQ